MAQNNGIKNARTLTTAAMLTAISVVIGIICKNFLTFGVYYRLTFENLPIILSGILFGPLVGGLTGCAADIISCLCSTNPAVNPLITVGAVAVGVVSGVVSRRVKGDGKHLLSVAMSHLIGQVAIKSVAKIIWFQMPWYGVFIGLGFSAVAGSVEYAAIGLLLKNKAIFAFRGDVK